MGEFTTVTVRGRPLTCQLCGDDHFKHVRTRLDKLYLGGLIRFEGAWGHDAEVYVCGRCGFLHWFFAVPGAVGTRPADDSREPAKEEPAEPTECLSCGKPIHGDAIACAACGWSWTKPTDE